MSVGTRGVGAKHGQHSLDDLRTYCVSFVPGPTLSTEIHHTKKAADYPELFWDEQYWQAPCQSRHSRLSAAGN
jgi:hypothetical protein